MGYFFKYTLPYLVPGSGTLRRRHSRGLRRLAIRHFRAGCIWLKVFLCGHVSEVELFHYITFTLRPRSLYPNYLCLCRFRKHMEEWDCGVRALFPFPRNVTACREFTQEMVSCIHNPNSLNAEYNCGDILHCLSYDYRISVVIVLTEIRRSSS